MVVAGPWHPKLHGMVGAVGQRRLSQSGLEPTELRGVDTDPPRQPHAGGVAVDQANAALPRAAGRAQLHGDPGDVGAGACQENPPVSGRGVEDEATDEPIAPTPRLVHRQVP